MTKCKTIFFLTVILLVAFSYKSVAQVDEMEVQSGLYYYSGTLGASEKIEFNLQFKGQAVSGSYILENTGDMFVFNGRLTVDRKGIGILVYNVDNIYVASIEARFVSEENNFGKRLSGSWKSADGLEVKQLQLKKVAEFAAAEEEITPAQSRVYGD